MHAAAALVPFVVAGSMLAAGLAACGGPAPTPRAWERVDPDPAGDNGPRQIVAWRGGYVGLGIDGAWRSDDGRDWAVAAIGTGLLGAWRHLVASPDALVAVFTTSTPEGRTRAEAWLSPDGSTWERAPDDAAMLPGPTFAWVDLWTVAAGPRGLIAIGQEGHEATTQPASWWSPDGRSWRRAAPPPGLWHASDALATEDGLFVLAGNRVDPRGPEFEVIPDGGFWFSADGLSWQAVPDDPSLVDGGPTALAAGRGIVVGLGYARTGDGSEGAVWTSPDGGRTWARVTRPFGAAPPRPTRGTGLSDVVTTGDGFTAVGWHEDPDPQRLNPDGEPGRRVRGHVWRSADGRSWELLPDPLIDVTELGPRLIPHGLFGVTAQPDGRLLVVGSTPELGATVWLAPGSSG